MFEHDLTGAPARRLLPDVEKSSKGSSRFVEIVIGSYDHVLRTSYSKGDSGATLFEQDQACLVLGHQST
jgi:hypothetical protein